MPLPAPLRPLRHKDFAYLAGAGLISHIGTWMQTVAVGALVVEATGQSKWVALVAAAQFLPIGALSPVGGAMADRVSRKRFLVTGYLIVTGLVGVLTWLSAQGRATPGVVVGLVFLTGCCAALLFPFQQAILPELVPREDLVAAVSIGAAEYNLGRVVGPTLGGAVVALTSFTWVFAINAVTFLAVVAAVARASLRPPPPPNGDTLWRSIRAGAGATWRTPGTRTAVVLISMTALLMSPFIALIAAVAERLTDGGKEAIAQATGVLTTAQGVGAVAGAFTLAALTARLGQRRTFVLNVVGAGLTLTLYSAVDSVALAAAALVLVGWFYIGILNGLSAAVQLHAPDEFRGRIISLFFLALGILYPVGSMLQGVVADATSLPATTVGGVAILGVALVALTAARPGFLAALDLPGDGPEPPMPVVPMDSVSDTPPQYPRGTDDDTGAPSRDRRLAADRPAR